MASGKTAAADFAGARRLSTFPLMGPAVRRWLSGSLLLLPGLLLASCGAREGGVRFAFVTNNASDFWTLVRRGVEQADRELEGVTVEFKIPQEGTAEQQQKILEDLVTRGVRGIAISPKDPENQKSLLNRIAASAIVICSDSDAPQSARVCYVGTDNVAAGRQAGEQIRAALPRGGKVIPFVGTLDAQNAVERLRGLREALEGAPFEIARVRTDETDRVRAKSNVLDALTTDADVACLVGIWSYNGPAIRNAVRERKLDGKVAIVCFDEEEETLQGVADGSIAATIVQQPYQFGHRSIHVLAKLAAGNRSDVPKDGLLHVPTRVITKDNVAAFRAELQKLRAGS